MKNKNNPRGVKGVVSRAGRTTLLRRSVVKEE